MINLTNLLSVITINYNNIKGLIKTIDSVRSQTYQNIEFIIIDGGSTDGSIDVIKNNADKIKYFISEKDNGVYHAQNKGILQSNGEYLIFLNSGDYFFANTIISDSIKYSFDKDIIYGDLYFNYGTHIDLTTYPDNITFNYFFNNGHLPHPSCFIKKSLFLKTGLYNETFKISSDWEFWLKAIFLHQASYKKIPLAVSVFNVGGLSTNKEGLDIIRSEKEKIYKKYFPAFIDDYKKLNAAKDNLSKNKFIKALKKLNLVNYDL